ncbi:hypothetical protein Plhal304r1_c017g0061011 [Plasmopara halstedii]
MDYLPKQCWLMRQELTVSLTFQKHTQKQLQMKKQWRGEQQRRLNYYHMNKTALGLLYRPSDWILVGFRKDA